jgi:restriction system protein
MNKTEQLKALAKKRQSVHLEGFKNLADFGPRCECEYVSPITKSAGNVESDILVFLQDLSSEDAMSNESFDPDTERLGYTPTMPTFRNLIRLLHEHLGKALADVYATNLFPLIKPRGMSEPIGHEAMLWAAKEFGIQHIKILTPRLVIILGGATFDALSEVARHPIRRSMSVAIESPFEFNGSYLWCQAHTGGLGIRNRGGIKRVNSDWQKMAAWYRKPAPAA